MKRIEDILKSSLKLIQIMASSSVEDIIQFALEEGSRLTGSKIGYFHFVNPDQQTIKLKTWSKETINVCSIGGKDSHYPIEKAGVWVDCIHQKKAVIHNDYNSLSHKKGLPEGHVPVVRDLAVPVIEDSKIVAVLGVGNKATEYNQHDIDRLLLLAENTWIIVQRKRAEESLRESEATLQSVFRAVPTGIGLVNNRILKRVNRQLCKMTGYRSDELIEKSARILYQNDKEFEWVGKKKYRQIDEQGIGTVETKWVRKDGKIIDILLSSTPVVSSDQSEGVTFTALDITERKLAEEERLLREKLQGVLETAGAVCHELNQPLHIISGLSELISYDLKEDNPLYPRINKIKEQIDRIGTITKKLIGIARCETKAHDSNTKILDLDKLRERRKYKRFIPRSRTYVIFKHDSSKQSQIIDISSGGLAFWCYEALYLSDGFAELAISMPDGNFNLDNIHCQTVSNLAIVDDSPSRSVSMKRCGVQFGDLTPNQTDRLEYFIQNHTIAN